MAANISKTDTYQPELNLGKKFDGNVAVYGENRTVVVRNGILIDEFKPLDVHIYKLK